MLPLLQSRYALLAGGLAAISFILLLLGYHSSSASATYYDVDIGLNASSRNLFGHVHNSTLGFERVFVINMPERTDHRDAITLAAALTGFKLNVIPGVDGSTVSPKALPDPREPFGPGLLGAWRAHMEAMRRIVEEDISSALIFEDDIDWDIQLKDRLFDFALSAHAVQVAESRNRKKSSIAFESLDPRSSPSHTPYGDHWDALWLGHCDMRIETERSHVLHKNDASVPELQYLKSYDDAAVTPLTEFGHHSRLVGHNDGTCSLAYAVTQKGARKILYDMGVRELWSAFDVMLAGACKSGKLNCFGSLPQLFDHHRPKGPRDKDSAISGAGGVREKAFTHNIRYSVRLNMEKLLDGDIGYEDQWPDTNGNVDGNAPAV